MKEGNGFFKTSLSWLSPKYFTENFSSVLPFVLFLVSLMVLYISYGYFTENTVRDLTTESNKLKELKAQYTTSFTELEEVKRQSSIAYNIQVFGLVESTSPPKKIVVKKK